MSRNADDVRLFVAVYPPPDIADAMLACLAALDLPDHRPVPVEQVHLTLHVIGDRPRRDLGVIAESVGRAIGGIDGCRMTPERLARLPERGPARLIACVTDAPASLLEIQQRLATRFARATRRRSGDRFLPHFTLCRFRSPIGDVSIVEPVAIPPFELREVVLVESTLTRGGAIHRPLAAFAVD